MTEKGSVLRPMMTPEGIAVRAFFMRLFRLDGNRLDHCELITRLLAAAEEVELDS